MVSPAVPAPAAVRRDRAPETPNLMRAYRPVPVPFVGRGLGAADGPVFYGGVMEFWTEPQMASIHKMLNPRSIAVVGATPRMQYGGRFLAAALKAKDRIRVYAVNPRYDE